MTKPIASKVTSVVVPQFMALNDLLLEVRGQLSEEEFLVLRKSVASIMGTMHELLHPILTEHADLAPDDIKDWYISKPLQ
jgi:hypothetical protein